MNKEEAYYLLDSEIINRLKKSGFSKIKKKYFWTQWGLNHLFIGWKIPQIHSFNSSTTDKI